MNVTCQIGCTSVGPMSLITLLMFTCFLKLRIPLLILHKASFKDVKSNIPSWQRMSVHRSVSHLNVQSLKVLRVAKQGVCALKRTHAVFTHAIQPTHENLGMWFGDNACGQHRSMLNRSSPQQWCVLHQVCSRSFEPYCSLTRV